MQATFKVVRAARRAIDSDSRLMLSINSQGGTWVPSQWAGTYIRKAKSTAIVSYAASAAAFLALCCEKVYCKADAEFFFHRVYWADGSEGDQEELDLDNEYYAEAIHRKTQLPMKHCRSLMNQEWRLTGEQAFELGIVDKLIG
jgi:ATP-dependent protease ClpP protease subunit